MPDTQPQKPKVYEDDWVTLAEGYEDRGAHRVQRKNQPEPGSSLLRILGGLYFPAACAGARWIRAPISPRGAAEALRPVAILGLGVVTSLLGNSFAAKLRTSDTTHLLD